LKKIEVVKLGIKLSKTRTDWKMGPCPPGWHNPKWEAERNEEFEELPEYVDEPRED